MSLVVNEFFNNYVTIRYKKLITRFLRFEKLGKVRVFYNL